jgi:hypothetical protein
MSKALKFYLPCPYCNWYGRETFKLVPKPGIENPNPSDLSHWCHICTHCGKEVELNKAMRKLKGSGGKYKPLKG